MPQYRFILLLSVIMMSMVNAFGQVKILPIINIMTENGKMPTCSLVSAPAGCWGTSITDNEFVNGRISITDGDTLVYDSGDYAETDDGERISGMRIRIRGNSSAQGEFTPYRIKLSKKADPLYFGHAEKSWNLLRPHCTWGKRYYLLDNHLGREIGLAVEMEWQPEYKFVELYLNDDYRGMYILTEVIERDEDRIDINKTGFIAEVDAYWWNEDPAYQFKTPRQDKTMAFTFKYPDEEDFDADPERLPQIETYINKVEDKIFAMDKDLGDYISLESFARWHLAQDILASRDCGGSNMFLYKKNLIENDWLKSKLCIGPLWDFDSSILLNDRWSHFHSYDYVYGVELFKREDFVNIYIEMCDKYLDNVSIRLDSLYNSLKNTYGENLTNAIKRHNERCGVEMLTLANHYSYLRQAIKKRIKWIKDNCMSLKDGIEYDSGIEDIYNDKPKGLYTIDGRFVTAVTDENQLRALDIRQGIYIIKDGLSSEKCFLIR